ncbi:MAG: double zinc ribbon domain-containing protein [Candidatus Bipolaricaulota bacterium]
MDYKLLKDHLGRIGYSVLDIFFPPHCYLCETPLETHGYICDDCKARFEKITPPVCDRCGAPLSRPGRLCNNCVAGGREFFLARSYGFYSPDGTLAGAIKGLKYGQERALAGELGPLLNEGLTGELVDMAEAITYVPLRKKKLKERGFNQARLLAESLSVEVDLPLVGALNKTRETAPQAELGRAERLVNVRESFEPVRPIEVDRVLLVDDVFTTGATADECSKALKEGGAERVYVVTVGRSHSRDARRHLR